MSSTKKSHYILRPMKLKPRQGYLHGDLRRWALGSGRHSFYLSVGAQPSGGRRAGWLLAHRRRSADWVNPSLFVRAGIAHSIYDDLISLPNVIRWRPLLEQIVFHSIHTFACLLRCLVVFSPSWVIPDAEENMLGLRVVGGTSFDSLHRLHGCVQKGMQVYIKMHGSHVFSRTSGWTIFTY